MDDAVEQINRFLNPTQLFTSSERSGGLRIAELSLTAVCRLAGYQIDKIQVRFKILKVCCKSKYSIFHFI